MKRALDIGSELRPGISWAEAVLETTSDGVSIQDRDHRILWANKTLKDDFGRDIVGKLCYEAYEKVSEPCRGCPVEEAIDTGRSAAATRVGITKNRRYWWAEIMATPLRDGSGEIVACVEIVRNVTERKLMEEETDRKSREIVSLASLTNKMGSVIDRHSVLSGAVDHLLEQGFFTAGLAFTGGPSGQYSLVATGGTVRPEQVPATLPMSAPLARLMRKTAGRVHWWKGRIPKSLGIDERLCKINKCVSVALVSLGCEGECSCFMLLGAPQEPSSPQRKHTEALAAQIAISLDSSWLHERVALSEERYRVLFEKCPIGMLALDRAGVVVAENRALLKMMGEKGKKGVIGQRLSEAASVVWAGLSQQVLELMAGSEVVLEDTPYVSLAGRRLRISVRGVPLVDAQGTLSGGLISVTDVTEVGRLKDRLLVGDKERAVMGEIACLPMAGADAGSLVDAFVGKLSILFPGTKMRFNLKDRRAAVLADSQSFPVKSGSKTFGKLQVSMKTGLLDQDAKRFLRLACCQFAHILRVQELQVQLSQQTVLRGKKRK